VDTDPTFFPKLSTKRKESWEKPLKNRLQLIAGMALQSYNMHSRLLVLKNKSMLVMMNTIICNVLNMSYILVIIEFLVCFIKLYK